MKTYTTPIQQGRPVRNINHQRFIPITLDSTRQGLALLSAVTVATGIVLLSVWAAGTGVSHLFAAGTWGLGLIFIGIAVDSPRPTALLQSITGLFLLGTAGLQGYVSPEYAIASGAIVAAWASVLTFRRLV